MLGFAVVLASRPPAWVLPISDLSTFPTGVAPTATAFGSRSGAQYRPRADLVPLAGALLRGDRQGRGRQGGAGGRGQPEGRHHQSMKGTTNPARLEQVTAGAGIPRLHQDFADISRSSARARGCAKPAHARRQLAALQARRSPQQRRRRRASGDRVRREEGDRAVSGVTRSPIPSSSIPTRRSRQRAGAAEIRRELAASDLLDRRKDLQGLSRKFPAAGEYRQALTKLSKFQGSIDELTARNGESAAAINKGSGAMKADLLSDQKRLESESDATIGETERLILMLAAGGFLLGASGRCCSAGAFPGR
jgi:hypothetical protein